MLFVLIGLWSVGIVLLIFERRSEAIRWLSGVVFCGGAGALSALIGDYAMGYAEDRGMSESVITALDRIRILFSLVQYYGLPYTYAMFAASYNPDVLPARLRRYLSGILLLPVAAMLTFIRPIHPIDYSAALLWVGPYVLGATILIVMRREHNSLLRRNHYFTSLAIVPTVLLCSVLNYVLPTFGLLEMWRYNSWIILFAIAMFVYAIFKFGFLGVQLLIQRRRIDFTFRAITSGTAILNHAIKNDVGKMKLFGEKIEQYAKESGQKELGDDIRVILTASRHIQEMIQRVHGQTQDLMLKPDSNSPTEMVGALLEQLSPYSGKITVNASYSGSDELFCDRAQTMEALNNIMMNAIEAMPNGGALHVRVIETKKYVIVEVRDNGTGIEKKQLHQVMEPFFTTKGDNRRNFGLGLAYCYQVMKKHGGLLDIVSVAGKGTTVTMSFPRVR